jgi:argonaute-like protein implicated in RNA metabolism and viral defense
MADGTEIGGRSVPFDSKSIFKEVKRYGPFLTGSTRQDPIRLGVLKFSNCIAWDRFQDRLLDMLSRVGCPSKVVAAEVLKYSSRREFEVAVTKLEDVADLLILVLPEDEQADDSESGSGAYLRFKEVTIPRDIASQAVQLPTLEKNDFVLENIALGIMSKAGAIPFVLAEPLSYANVVVGLDIARKGKAKLAGSANAAATARFFNCEGKFLRYWLPDHLIEGETIPKDVLERMFPAAQFSKKRVLVHRDGRFRGDEKDALVSWGKEIGSTILLVEVIKSGAPRLYALEQIGDKKVAARPPKGLCLRMNDKEAFLVSSLPPFSDATPQPLQVRVHGGITIEQACHSVLALTLVHIGSKLAPRLPVTVHFADQIAELALKNIKPRSLEGDLPFWL